MSGFQLYILIGMINKLNSKSKELTYQQEAEFDKLHILFNDEMNDNISVNNIQTILSIR